MDKSSHVSADELGNKVIKELRKLVGDEDSYTEEGFNLGIKTAIDKIKEVYKREEGYDLED